MAATYRDVPHATALSLGLFQKPDGTHGKIFTGATDREVHEAMDRVKTTVERAGGAEMHRTKIGRNTSCPCGSGFKYKKCCLNGQSAEQARAA